MRHSCQLSQTVRTTIIVALMLAVGISSTAQERRTKTVTGNLEGDIFLLKEFGGIVAQTDDTIKIEMVMPSENLAEKYKEVDIQAGDIIKMINGKSLTSVKDLKKIYEELAVGDAVKLGLFRGKRMLIVQFEKADPEELPGKMMVIAGPASEGDVATGLIDAGLILADKDGKIVIEDIIDNMKAEFSGQSPQRGDVITSIQGNKLASPEQVSEIYDKIESGKTVEMTLLRQDKEITTGFQKPDKNECPATKMMKVQKKGE